MGCIKVGSTNVIGKAALGDDAGACTNAWLGGALLTCKPGWVRKLWYPADPADDEIIWVIGSNKGVLSGWRFSRERTYSAATVFASSTVTLNLFGSMVFPYSIPNLENEEKEFVWFISDLKALIKTFSMSLLLNESLNG